MGFDSNKENVNIPKEVSFFNHKPAIKQLATGNNFSLVLLEDGSVYGFGSNLYLPAYSTTPTKINLPGGQATFICCTSSASIVKTSNNLWYAFGNCDLNISREIQKVDMPCQIYKMVGHCNAFVVLSTDSKLFFTGGDTCTFGSTQTSWKKMPIKQAVSAVYNGQRNCIIGIGGD